MKSSSDFETVLKNHEPFLLQFYEQLHYMRTPWMFYGRRVEHVQILK